MGIEKKCASTGRTYRIYAPADLNKNWMVSVNNADGKRIKRIYKHEGISINQYKTAQERMDASSRIIDMLVSNDPKEGFKTYKEKAMDWMLTQPWRLKSFRSYRSIYRAYFKFIGDEKPSVRNTEAFMAHIRVNRYSTTYNNYRRKLKRILDNLGFPNLLNDVKKIREHRRPARYFQRSQIDVLKPAILRQWPDLLLFCQLQYYCFIRPKEARHLQAQHILLDSEQILIVGQEAKNANSEYVVMPDQIVPILKSHIKNLAPKDWLFPGVYDKNVPIGENTMWRRHHNILKKMGFGDGFELYSWKHTGAIHYSQNQGNPVQLSIQMRHKSLDQTMEYLRQLGVKDLYHLKSNIPDM